LFEVIGNGFDLQRFQPDAAAKARLCHELHIDPETALVGLVARFDPQKNHFGFIMAAQSVARRFPQVNFILAGRHVDNANAALRDWIAQNDGVARLHLLGERHDIPQLTAALDVAVSCSIYGESFPNTVGEAMACAVPCVVTDIGDAAFVAGQSGLTVAPDDTQALAEAILRLLQMSAEERAALGQQARRRMLENFSLPVVADKYAALYASLR
jgi:glycosyltransferase involved in cell wall biosynthesis